MRPDGLEELRVTEQPPRQDGDQHPAAQQPWHPAQNYPQQGPAQYGPPGPVARTAPARGLPVWVALVVVIAVGVAVILLEPVFIKKGNAAAPGAATPLPSQAVSTAVRPSTSNQRVYADPLPASIKPGWRTVDLMTDTNTTPASYSGNWRPVSKAQYTAWVAHVRTQGFTNTPGKQNDAINYDLRKGHIRLLGDYDNLGAGDVTFVYDPNGY